MENACGVQHLNHHVHKAFAFDVLYQKYEFFVEVQDFEDRGVKGLTLAASEGVSEITTAETFELYVIREDLDANPIAENAASLRAQAEVCNIEFGMFNSGSSNIVWIDSVVNSIDDSSCVFTVCSHLDCESGLIRPQPDGDIEGYRFCECDVVVGLDDDDNVYLFTVEDKGTEETPVPNDIKLIALFDPLPPEGDLEGTREVAGLPPINSPVFPAEVPRFNTLQVWSCILYFCTISISINTHCIFHPPPSGTC